MALGFNCFYCKKPVHMTPTGAKHALVGYSDCALIDRAGNLFACDECRKAINEKKREERQAREQRDKEHWDSIPDLFGGDDEK